MRTCKGRVFGDAHKIITFIELYAETYNFMGVPKIPRAAILHLSIPIGGLFGLKQTACFPCLANAVKLLPENVGNFRSKIINR